MPAARVPNLIPRLPSPRGAAAGMLLACAALASAAAAVEDPDPPNVLLIIADDLGIDRVGAYAAHPDPGDTPVIDALAAQGVLFRNAYSDPLCSPTRANMLTGRYGFRTGLNDALNYVQDDVELELDEICIPEALPPAYRSAAIGKWHLTTQSRSGPLHPLLQGFEHHAGTLANIAAPDTYYEFAKSVDGSVGRSTTYATTDSVNDALAWIAATPEPWFTWLAFNAPHSPFHAPPTDLCSDVLPPLTPQTTPEHYKAVVEAMDTEIGRLLSALDPQVRARTVVVFVGDNGTTPEAVTAPFAPGHAKGQVYEGGVHVPLIVSGPGVAPGAECQALINTTDVFATVLELAGGDATSGVDSVSFAAHLADPELPSARQSVYAGLGYPHGYYPELKEYHAVRDRRFKLLHRRHEASGLDSLEMYDVANDPFELDDLLLAPLGPAAQTAHDVLLPLLGSLVSPWTLLGGGIDGPFGAISLRGFGPLLGGEEILIELRRAPANASALLAFSTAPLLLPLHGGTLVPDVFASPSGIAALLTSPQGKIDIEALWPDGLPAGLELWLQFWIVDASDPSGWSASNGLRAITP